MKKIFVLIFVIFIISLVGCTKTGPDDIEKIQNQFSGVFYAKVECVTASISSIRLDTTIEIKEDKLYMGDREYQLDTQNFIDNFCLDDYSIKNDFKFPQTGLSATIGEDIFKYCYIFLKNKKNDLYMFEISQNNEENINYIIASYKLEKRDEEKESLIDLSLYLKDVEKVSGYYGTISSYVFMSDNKNLIDFLVKKASNIKFTEILTEENYDKINIMDNRSFTFYLQDGNISLYFNDTGNIYAVNNCIAYNTNRQIKTFGTLNLSKKSKSRPLVLSTNVEKETSFFCCLS